MTIEQAIAYFEDMSTLATSKSRRKLYDQFVSVLKNLESKKFLSGHIEELEKKIERIKLACEADLNQKDLKKQLHGFLSYLNQRFGFVKSGYYTNMGIVLGVIIGTMVGTLVSTMFERSAGIALGNTFGFIIGYMIGYRLDVQAQTEQRLV
ncbi:MAG: hypothetical protein JXQ87_11680 [Bacteroidia bacterium]